MIKSRLVDIDRAKGLAIFLVVVGHLVRGTPPRGNGWYTDLLVLIYNFHMSFFMFISGIIMSYSDRNPASISAYIKHVKKKAKRFLLPFFLFGILVGLGKEVFHNFIFVDNINTNLFNGMLDLLIRPTESFSSSLWFIYVLLVYYIIIPILLFICKGELKYLLLIGILIHFLPMPNYFALDQIVQYLFFFVLGIYAMKNWEYYISILDKYNIAFIIVFFMSLSLNYAHISGSVSKFLIGMASLPALHSFVRMQIVSNDTALRLLGKFTFSIYLLNTICIGVVKGITLKFISWEGENFFFFFILLSLSGTLLPILIKRSLFKRISWLDQITA